MTIQTWVVVADVAGARFFECADDRTLEEFDLMTPPESRRDPAKVFASRLAEHIDDARVAGFIDRLVLIAPSDFQGQLRSELCKDAREMIIHSVDKDLTSATAEEVAGHLPATL